MTPSEVWDSAQHHYADNNGTKIHYATLGEGDPVLFVHGFPDFWYSWRDQMAALAPHFKAVAMDTRGYNLSDKPEGVDAYRMENLLADIKAVINDLGVAKVNLVGHDWGGAICWQFAMSWSCHHEPDPPERLCRCGRESIRRAESQRRVRAKFRLFRSHRRPGSR
jgi:alpha-beta hydrolase superfamily lysophospholipase